MLHALTIRPVTFDDAAVLAKLSESIGREHAEAEPGKFRIPPRDDATAEFVRLLSEEGCDGLIAHFAEIPVGYAIYKLADRVASPFSFPGRYLQLQHLSVEPEYRQQGIGSQIMESIVNFARNNQIDEIQLDVWLFNLSAIDFYVAKGFATKTQRMLLRIETGK